jgi:hypothetical protein
MKQAEDKATADIFPKRVGRPPLSGRAMTVAERKARSRANGLGEVDGQLAVAEKLCGEWMRCMRAGRPAVTDRDIEAAFEEIALHVASARLALPRS